ncbi:hypothetical protein QQS21_005014 [Conoideocrella luteorostrata]|uniref:Uncharacterized protein n=1 Tax=Conoideocrella luteorostrata TaxID=1105319 RepID=A0AAJ0CUE9_9HYPO|nr:hypothetical protein QQS21_005014 [Conoideocrella luteorostrata]
MAEKAGTEFGITHTSRDEPTDTDSSHQGLEAQNSRKVADGTIIPDTTVSIIDLGSQSIDKKLLPLGGPLEEIVGGVSDTKSTSTKSPCREHVHSVTSFQSSASLSKPDTTPSKFHMLRLELATIVSCLGLLSVVITYVQATYAAERSSQQGLQLSSLMKTEASRILTIIRTSQGILSLLITIAINSAFAFFQWDGMARPQGLPYLTLLSMAPSTNVWGLCGIIKSGAPSVSTKAWATLSATSPCMGLWSSVILVPQDNTSSVTVYDTALAYPVTAGIGRFNGSYVQPFRALLRSLRPGYAYETIPYDYLASSYTLVLNPLVSTVTNPRRCVAQPCMSYLLSGGLTTVIPWVPRQYAEHSLVRVKHAPSIQADFSGPIVDDLAFIDSDCDIFGQDGVAIGIRLCLKINPLDPSALMAGIFVCPKGIAGGACSRGKPSPNMTTEVSFYSLQTSFVSSRLNYTIVSIDDSTVATPIHDLDLPAYRDALRWLLNYTDANLPPPSSIAESFWSSQKLLTDPSTWGILTQNFQSILVFPFWLFNANNWGNTQVEENATISTLPSEFYTEASLVEPYVKLRVDPSMFAIFLAAQIAALVFVSGVVVWAWLRKGPLRKSSSFPMFDIVFRAEVQGDDIQRCSTNVDDHIIIDGLKDKKIAAA